MTREWLVALKKRAIRRRSWFRSLTKIERGIVELTIRCVSRVRSAMLALVIGRIVGKIKSYKGEFLRRVERVGYNFVEKISRIAVKWGCVEALNWKRDLGFVRYLGLNANNILR